MFKVHIIKFNKFNYKKAMNIKSKALRRSLTALEDHFPTLILPSSPSGQSLFDYLENVTSQLLPSKNINIVIEKMKSASDAQEYRIQKNLLQLQNQSGFNFAQEICYEVHSTAILADRQIYSMKHEGDGSSLVDDIWWNAEKKMQEIEYFMD